MNILIAIITGFILGLGFYRYLISKSMGVFGANDQLMNEVLGRLGYDALLKLRRAVNQEMAKREPKP